MTKEQVLNILKSMPNFKEDLKEKYLQLSQIAINHITTILKNKKPKEDEKDILLMLCASLVNLWITREICSNSPTGSFSGNGYRITKDSKKQLELAKQLFESWRALCSNLLIDQGFSFFSTKEFLKNEF